jgi:ABC-type uncharacterized transport system involved in gliding motility auxiliary subunit
MRGPLRFLGWAGLVLVVFGVASYGFADAFDLWTAVHLVGGGALLAAGILLNLAGFRRSVSLAGTRQRLQAALGTFLFGGILVAVNVLAARHPWRHDATESGIHTLSEQTRAVLAHLDRTVELLAFFGAGDAGKRDLAEMLDRFAAASPRLTWRFVDPEQDPSLADRYGVARRGVLVARSGETSAESAGDREGGALSEGVVANLVLKVTRPGPRAVYFLSGHGEAAPDDAEAPGGAAALAEALRGENFEVRTLLLAAQPAVAADAALLAVIGPRKPLLPHEVSEIRAYLERGGRVLLLLDPGTDPGLAPVLADFRVAVGDDMIVDREQIPFLGARLGLDPIVEDFPPHPITRDFKERLVLFEARSVDAKTEGGLPGVGASVIARTRPSSWAVADYRKMLSTGAVPRGPGDLPGPVPVAVAARRAPPAGADAEGASSTAPKAAPRLVVIGDSDLATNAHLAEFFNKEFLLNAVAWLRGQEDLIAERPRGFRPSRLDMTEADYRNLFRFSVLLFPEALLIVGLAVWWRRRLL